MLLTMAFNAIVAFAANSHYDYSSRFSFLAKSAYRMLNIHPKTGDE
ncbi:MAG: hypothetical protein HRU20_14020 [Pseudomonadales bacterium]|nr:hypothetical protein [Pseudomonadales bacterium]